MLYYKGLNDLKLKKIILTNFGKFENFILDLDDGLNVVYGKNEAGKSTIQAFIHGMFYGFLKPDAKKTIYLDELKKYEPFDRTDYRGSMLFEHEKVYYRIERTFKKNSEDLRVYNEVTGEDITKKFANSGNTRIIQPGFYFFNMDYTTFKNTISLGQNEATVDKKISEKLRERLSNSYQTNSENISLNNALNLLENKRKEIGSIKAKTSDYAKIIDKVGKNEERLREIKAKEQQYDEYLIKRLNVIKEISELNTYIEELNSNLDKIYYYEKFEKYLKAKKLVDNIALTREKIEIINPILDISNEDIIEIENIDKILEGYQNELNMINREKAQIISNINDIGYDENRYLNLIESKEKINKLIQLEPKKEVNSFEKDIDRKTKQRLKFINVLTILFIAIDTSISVYAFNKRNMIALISIQAIWVFILILHGYRKKVLKQIDILDQYQNEKSDYLALLKQEGFSDVEDLKEKLDDIISEINLLDLDKKDIYRMKMRLKDLEDKEILTQKTFDNYRQKIEEILSKHEVNSIEEIYQAYEKHRENKVLENELRLNEDILKTLLKTDSFEELENEFNNIKSISQPLNYDKKSDLETELRNKRNERMELEKKLSNLEGILKSTDNLFEEKMYIEEENKVLKNKLDEYDLELKAIEIAESKINRISEDIHSNFAPELNRKIGEKINFITSGKYSTIKVDKDMCMKVLEPKTNKLISLDRLSYGTVDQINFALRLALSEEIGAEKLPVILDEPFAHFDDERLKNTLDMLNKIKEERQVILFTCHKTEQILLEKMECEVNFLQI
ncbi:hypothetical protein E8P77_03530 [Soehngenia saccharolytica]|nr:hypothetical protein E8P77_03530 [Soehngenia saccharolytica]